MTPSRLSAGLLASAAMIALAACGGGGGGGATPPTNPGGPPPVTGTPTPAPSSGGTSTPTASPTATPTTAPTATPTATPTPGGVTVSSVALSAHPGPQVNGDMSWYNAGVTAWAPNAGETSAGPNANGSAPIDGMSCGANTEPASSTSTYSVHSFVGIYYNGTELAIPSAVGMQNPVEPTKPTANAPSGHPNDTYEVEAWNCEYNVHTHDYSGLVHIEDPNVAQSTSPTSPLSYAPTLQTFLDLWGVQLTANGLTVPGGTTLSGPVAIYYGTQGTDKGPHGDFETDSYTKVSSASAAPLGFHDVAWIVIGQMPTAGLPKIEWRVEY